LERRAHSAWEAAVPLPELCPAFGAVCVCVLGGGGALCCDTPDCLPVLDHSPKAPRLSSKRPHPTSNQSPRAAPLPT
jgi:hypothetical protein